MAQVSILKLVSGVFLEIPKQEVTVVSEPVIAKLSIEKFSN